MKDKTFNWCEKCHRWTVTHTTATHTGGERCPPAPAPSPRANLSMLMPDFSVWALDFPVEPETFTSNSLCHVVINLIRGFNPWLLLVFSLTLCALVPNLVTLAFYLTSAIPWSTILAWVANTLHQVILCHPALAFAPTVWIALLSLSLWPPTSIMQPPNEQNKTVPFTRSQRRRFSKLLKQSLAPPRFNAGIRTNKLHCSYPLRLRQQGYVTPFAPSITQRADFLNFDTLKDHTLRLQRRVAMLRHSQRFAFVPSNTGQKGRRRNNKNLHLRPPWVPKTPRPSQRKAKYCPVPASHSPNPFAIAPLTICQSCRTFTWRFIQRLSAWPFKLPLVCATPSAPKPTQVQLSGTQAQAFRFPPTSPTFMAPSLLQERSLN